jgi:hypothetical protein
MKRVTFWSFLLMALLVAGSAVAGPVKVYVGEFSATGVANRDELRAALQGLMASRLKSDTTLTVDSASGADVLVSGSYVVFGKVFSVDAVARDRSGAVLSRAYEQGESQDELIPAMGRLAGKLLTEIGSAAGSGRLAAVTAPPVTAAVAPAAPQPSGEIVRSRAVVVAAPAAGPSSEIIRAQAVEHHMDGNWTSKRLVGNLIGIAPGKDQGSAGREIYLAGRHSVQLYRQGQELSLLAEVNYPVGMDVLGVDTADLDGDGNLEAYVTILQGNVLVSEVLEFKGNALRKLAVKQPYFYRMIALDGGKPAIFTQQISSGDDFFYGDVRELVRKGDRFEPGAALKLPRFGFLYNFTTFKDAQGKRLTAVLNDDGYIVVNAADGEELWRSSDKFGGSENNFKREDLNNMRVTGDPNRWRFLEQRLITTPAGEIIVPQNNGLFVVGNNRSYKKNSIFAFAWNGSTLDERWHTKVSQNYLSDYYYDDARHELVILEVVKKDGLLGKGASTVVVKKID